MAKLKISLNFKDKEFIKNYSNKYNISISELEKCIRSYKTMYREILKNEFEVSHSKLNRSKYFCGILGIDLAFLGLSHGIIHLYGRDDTFKTSIALFIGAHLDNTLYINADNKDIPWTMPKNTNMMLLEGRHTLNSKLVRLFRASVFNMIIIDSLIAMDRAMNTFRTMIKLCGEIRDLKVLVTNQTRASKFSNTDDRPAGGDFYTSAASEVIKIEAKDKKPYGYSISLYNETLKKRTTIHVDQYGAICNELYVISLGLAKGLIEKRGAKLRTNHNNVLYSYKELINSRETLNFIWTQIPQLKEMNNNVYLGKRFSII